MNNWEKRKLYLIDSISNKEEGVCEFCSLTFRFLFHILFIRMKTKNKEQKTKNNNNNEKASWYTTYSKADSNFFVYCKLMSFTKKS